MLDGILAYSIVTILNKIWSKNKSSLVGLTVGLLFFVSTNCKYRDSGTVTDAFRQTATPILIEAKLCQSSQHLQKVRVKDENTIGYRK